MKPATIAIVERLKEAARRVAAAHHRRVLLEARRTLTRSQRSHRAAPELAGEVSRLREEVDALLAAAGDADRWAVARELVALEKERVPCWLIARALIEAKAWEGTTTPADLRRCMAWARQEKCRLRQRDEALKRSRGNAIATSRDVCEPLGSERDDVPNEEIDMTKKLIKRTTVTETFEADEELEEAIEGEEEDPGLDDEAESDEEEEDKAKRRKSRR